MKKALALGLILLLVPLISCTKQIQYENLLSVGTGQSVLVEQYEYAAYNMRKIHDGIEILCKGKDTLECKEIRVFYNKTRVVFISKGDTLIAFLNEKDTEKKNAIYEQYLKKQKEFDALWFVLKEMALKLGIGGIK